MILGPNFREWFTGIRRTLSRPSATRLNPSVLAAARQDTAGMRKALCIAIQTLKEPYRAVVLRHYIEAQSVSEIARSVQLPESTVRDRLRRAMCDLRADLNRHFGDKRG
jgi:DNA-directed RNA polymerase specialized sigma24 family protein